MATSDCYNEFMNYSDTITEIQNDSTRQLALANHCLSSTLLLDSSTELSAYINNLETNQQKLQKLYPKLMSMGVAAFNNVNSSINTINSKLEEMVEDNDTNFELTNQTINTLQETINALQETIKELSLTNSKQATEISRLRKAVLPPTITNDDKLNAKFLIDNVKNQQGKSIKGASITIDNVASILAFYDRLEEYKEEIPQEKEVQTNTKTRRVKPKK